jgi:hypothetical protein
MSTCSPQPGAPVRNQGGAPYPEPSGDPPCTNSHHFRSGTKWSAGGSRTHAHGPFAGQCPPRWLSVGQICRRFDHKNRLWARNSVQAVASSQSEVPVCLRLKTPPSVPDAWIRQAHFFHPRRPSSKSPERESSGWPPSHSTRSVCFTRFV